MRATAAILLLLLAGITGAQDTVYVCPMDPDVRSSQPGFCPRCSMKLVAGLPDPVEYRLDLTVTPRLVKAGQNVQIGFTVRDPWKGRPVTRFQTVHERLFHLFVVSQDLAFFVHDHPTLLADGTFSYPIAFPTPGMYRLLADFYPDGGTPQLIAKTLIVPGAAGPPVTPPRDYSPKDTRNLHVELTTDPPQPVAGMKTMLLFRARPRRGPRTVSRRVGPHAGRQQRSDRSHSHPPVPG